MNKEIPKTYSPTAAEDKWYAYWMKNGFFKSTPDEREPYTIVIPPPNVTGVLHMGHMLNNTIQDVLIRRARMLGKNACWVPGTDHASIATEAKVVALLKEKGIAKSSLSRDEFLSHAWEWKEKYGGIILEQLKKLGASCDWDRTKFTMDEGMSEAVIDVFIDLHKKGHIYRGVRMVNWDPQGLTAVSDEEVIHKEVNSRLFYVRYLIEDEKATKDGLGNYKLDTANFITIATTRPETILGDTAVCVHPDDPRYKHLKGKKCVIPMVNRSVPIIFDKYIDMEFGTGALKVTPAHDINDYNLGIKHNLKVIDTIAPDGKMSQEAGFFIGEDRFVVRKKIADKLEKMGHIVKIEEIKNKVGYSERTDAVIEPKLSVQWFLKMDKISKPALDAVLNGDVHLIPEKFVNTYKHWMENVHDWCISRQLWWGQRIPAWYNAKGEFVVAKNEADAIRLFKEKNQTILPGELRQDEDVLDTWFSSWLWPISVFNGFKDPGNKEINYYYPTNDLITAPEILFFWVARMMMAGFEYRKEKPFTNVYLTGIVRDKLGRKMSKSLGNSPDPLDLIAKYGADGVRVGMLLCSPAGNDLPFDEVHCEQGRNFANKIWNAYRLVSGWTVDPKLACPDSSKTAADWFAAKLNAGIVSINDLYSRYRISEALMASYKLIWDDFCAWYLEMIKPDFVDGNPMPIDKETFDRTILFFEQILKVIHPFMPFITEEIWHLMKERDGKDCIMLAAWPMETAADEIILREFEEASELIVQIRNVRNEKKISPKEKLELFKKKSDVSSARFQSTVIKLSNLTSYTLTDREVENSVTFRVHKDVFYIPFSSAISVEDEKLRLQKDLEYQNGFLQSVMKKLSNERFVQNAKPEIIEMERKKQADAEEKIRSIQKQLASMN